MRTGVPGVLAQAVSRFPDTEAVVTQKVRWTFADLEQRARRAAQALVGLGVKPGDRVGIWAPNSAEWVVALLGIHLAGAAVVPINTRFRQREAADVVHRSGARVVFCAGEFLDFDYVAAVRDADLPSVEHIIVLDESASGDESLLSEQLRDAPEVDLPDVTEDELSDVMYTSGTTGRPKGVMATHGQTIRVYTEWAEIVGLEHGDRYLIVNPFFHTFGYKAGILACLLTGATIVPEAVFDVATVMRRVGEEAITVLPGPPTLFLSILSHPERESTDISSLRLAVTGAAAIPVEMIRRMRSELHFDTVLTGYGLTESTGTVTMCRRGDDPETIATTSGRAIPDVEVRVVDDDGVEVGPHRHGEIVVRGYNVMSGYLDDPRATAEAVDADGWLQTGDIGVLDERGYLSITDRKKDMMIVGGFNAYPAEIENTLLAHPDIAQCAVIGAPDERLGEVPEAFLVARDAAEIEISGVIAWCREQLANYKVPRRVHVVEELPMNASGKVLKDELRQASAAAGSST